MFTFEDCLNGGRGKAEAAAEALSKIFPAVTAQAFTLSVPMPAHPLSSSTESDVKRQFNQLEELTKSNDVIFLLMVTREYRWLPTVLGAYHKKLVIISALGFDSFLVMRHGIPNKQNETPDVSKSPAIKSISVPGDNLGCYFCNDVIAPRNSL